MKGAVQLCDYRSADKGFVFTYVKSRFSHEPLDLNWVLMTVIAKNTREFLYKLLQRILFCGNFLVHVSPNWYSIKLCLT